MAVEFVKIGYFSATAGCYKIINSYFMQKYHLIFANLNRSNDPYKFSKTVKNHLRNAPRWNQNCVQLN